MKKFLTFLLIMLLTINNISAIETSFSTPVSISEEEMDHIEKP